MQKIQTIQLQNYLNVFQIMKKIVCINMGRYLKKCLNCVQLNLLMFGIMRQIIIQSQFVMWRLTDFFLCVYVFFCFFFVLPVLADKKKQQGKALCLEKLLLKFLKKSFSKTCTNVICISNVVKCYLKSNYNQTKLLITKKKICLYF